MHPLTLGTTAEGRAPRRRLQRNNTENDDPLRKTALSLPFQKSKEAPPLDPKMSSNVRRRSTLRDNGRPLLGPRPLESKRYVGCFSTCGQCGRMYVWGLLISIAQGDERKPCSADAAIVPSHFDRRQHPWPVRLRRQPTLQLHQTAREQPEQGKHGLPGLPPLCQLRRLSREPCIVRPGPGPFSCPSCCSIRESGFTQQNISGRR